MDQCLCELVHSCSTNQMIRISHPPMLVHIHLHLSLYVMRLANALRGCAACPPPPNCCQKLTNWSLCCRSGLENVIHVRQKFSKFFSRTIDNTISCLEQFFATTANCWFYGDRVGLGVYINDTLRKSKAKYITQKRIC